MCDRHRVLLHLLQRLGRARPGRRLCHRSAGSRTRWEARAEQSEGTGQSAGPASAGRGRDHPWGSATLGPTIV
jgi:hypothetical protein